MPESPHSQFIPNNYPLSRTLMPQKFKKSPQKSHNDSKKSSKDQTQSSKLENLQIQPSIPPPENIHQQSIQLEISQVTSSISSKSSAFWPFTRSFEDNNFLSHIISQDQEPFSQKTIQKAQAFNFIEDPTQQLFTRLKKFEGNCSFEIDQIVLAKCVGEPLWPAKITSIDNVEGWLPDGKVYNLKFINESNTCMIDKTCLVKFNEYSMKELRNAVENKKLLRAIKLAEKYFKQQLKDSQSEQLPDQNLQNVSVSKLTEIQLSLSSLQSYNISPKDCNKITQNIEIRNDGFLMMKNIMAPKDLKGNADKCGQILKNQNKKASQNVLFEEKKSIGAQIKAKKANIFKPIILLKGETIEINLHAEENSDKTQEVSEQNGKDSHRKNNLKVNRLIYQKNAKIGNQDNDEKDKNKNAAQDPINGEDKQEGVIKISKSLAKPVNLVLQTPKLNPSEYYLNKIIVKFNQASDEELKPSGLQGIDLDETVMEECFCEEDSHQLKVTQKVHPLKNQSNQLPTPKKTGAKHIAKLNSYFLELIQDLQGINPITQKKMKEDSLLEFLSLPLQTVVNHGNKLEYDKLLKTSLLFLQKCFSLKIDELFVMNLQHKLEFIFDFLHSYRGDNYLITRVKNKNASILNKFCKSEPKKHSSQISDVQEKQRDKQSKKAGKKNQVTKIEKDQTKVIQVKTNQETSKDGQKSKRKSSNVQKVRKMMIQSDEQFVQDQETCPCDDQTAN